MKRRWNGWGYLTTDYPLPPSAADYLEDAVGPGQATPDVSFEALLAAVPDSRLPAPLPATATTEPDERLLHARGQSLPDWIALRSGRGLTFPDGVAYPRDAADVRALLAYAAETGASLIPYGGGTSVVGHVNALPDLGPALTVDLKRMNQLHHFDEPSHLATFGAGVCGPDLEAQLRARGCTLGHFPQSFELSTLGGWIASRSSGQQSYHYGRIEDLFAGGQVETPAGPLHLPPHPASAAGPDLRHLVLGCEGRLGIITQATVRVSPLPEREDFHAVFFRDWESGHTAVRRMAQARLPVSMLRLSNAVETSTTLALAGHERLIGLGERALALRGYGEDKCLLLFGLTGGRGLTKRTRKEVLSIAKAHEGFHVGKYMGNKWHESRFHTPYLRNTLWDLGYALDTLETAVSWSAMPEAVEAVQAALRENLDAPGERILVFAHLSHVYSHGTSFYVTYLFRRAADPAETLRRWQGLKAAASRAILTFGGTISHQHGVGTDHAPYLEAEKGELGIKTIETTLHTFDPQGVMNPGKLLEK